MVHKQEQETPQGLVRRVPGEETRRGGAQFVDLLPVDRLNEGFAGLEVAVERPDRHPGPPGDLLHVSVGLAGEERLSRGGQESLSVAPRIGAQRT